MLRTLGIDPGADQGWAILDGGMLQSCGLGDPPGDLYRLVVIECPKIYDASTGRADPNRLAVLIRRVGRLEERFKASPQLVVYPSDWKGETPKKVHNGRVLGKLTAREMSVFCNIKVADGLRHNVIDAIGLAKFGCYGKGWSLGRS